MNYLMNFLRDSGLYEKYNQLCDERNVVGWDHRFAIVSDVQNQLKQEIVSSTSVRGLTFDQLERRSGSAKYERQLCPVLGCDHVFPATDGVNVYDNGSLSGEETGLRLNPIVSHLASHGICNTGRGETHDQRYFSIQEYLPIYERRGMTPDGKLLTESEVVLAVASRSTRALLDWMEVKDISDEEIVEKVKKHFFID